MAYYFYVFFVILSVIFGFGAVFGPVGSGNTQKFALFAIACALIAVALK